MTGNIAARFCGVEDWEKYMQDSSRLDILLKKPNDEAWTKDEVNKIKSKFVNATKSLEIKREYANEFGSHYYPPAFAVACPSLETIWTIRETRAYMMRLTNNVQKSQEISASSQQTHADLHEAAAKRKADRIAAHEARNSKLHEEAVARKEARKAANIAAHEARNAKLHEDAMVRKSGGSGGSGSSGNSGSEIDEPST